jgi:hypothetical protein
MLIGLTEFNMDEWEQSAIYKGYAKSNKQIGWFWEVCLPTLSFLLSCHCLLICAGGAFLGQREAGATSAVCYRELSPARRRFQGAYRCVLRLVIFCFAYGVYYALQKDINYYRELFFIIIIIIIQFSAIYVWDYPTLSALIFLGSSGAIQPFCIEKFGEHNMLPRSHTW